ncbi:MAG: RNA polymerase sigma factor [Planctomycetota bacterium]
MLEDPDQRPSSPEPEDPARSDADLVARCLAAGQSYDAAFEALYQRHSARVFGFLLRLTNSRGAAEDALQETFLRVYKSLERFDARRDLGAWLLQIARYVAIDAFRVERKVKRLEERRAEEREEVQAAECPAERGERERLVDEVLAALGPEDRSLLLLRHYEGLTFPAIGEVIDCSARTAQNRVAAAARRFQQELSKRRVQGEDL